MIAGKLTEQIGILRPILSINEYGERNEDWSEIYQTKARLVNNYGNQTEQNGEIFHSYVKTIEVWHYVDVVDTDLIVWDNKKYRIIDLSVDKVQLKKVLKLEMVNE